MQHATEFDHFGSETRYDEKKKVAVHNQIARPKQGLKCKDVPVRRQWAAPGRGWPLWNRRPPFGDQPTSTARPELLLLLCHVMYSTGRDGNPLF